VSSPSTALNSLRGRVLDESESLAGLLRACLMLGTETHSENLRGWASKELNGYDEDDELPEYRRLTLPMYLDSTSGPHVTRGQQISPLQVPESVRAVVPEIPREVDLRGPITELEHMATTSDESIRLAPGWFAELAALWSTKLGSSFQHIDAVYFKATPNTIAGVVSRVRTMLVELISEISSGSAGDVPPSGNQVDTAVNFHIYGKGHKVNWNQSSPGAVAGGGTVTTKIQTGEDEGWWTWPRRVGAMVVGGAAIAGSAVAVVKDWPF
jgi:hypothetical protein